MVKLDIFFLKTQSKCIDKTLMKKLFQQLKLNEFYQLLKKAHVFLFFLFQSHCSVYSSLQNMRKSGFPASPTSGFGN